MSHADQDGKIVSYPGHGVGLRNVGSYQVSGRPWLTGSVLTTDGQVRVQFPFVTKSITLQASGTAADVRAHWAEDRPGGRVLDGGHYITLQNDRPLTVNVKCKEVYISCVGPAGATTGFELFAELTNIDATRMFALTGSGLTE